MDWFKTWFNTPYYHILYDNRDYVEAENFLRLLIEELALPTGADIIDLGCGRGRHSVFLNKSGFRVTGLDISQENIEFDKQYENPTLHFAVHDMRNPIPLALADAVLNLFTSFGYFDDAQDDERVFASVVNALKPRGYFVLDFLNESVVKHNLQPYSEITKGGITFHIEKSLQGSYIRKDIRFRDHGTDYHYFEKVKLYASKEIEELAHKAGLEITKTWGDYHLGTFNTTSPRNIHLFRKI